jgi:cytochrome bd ubiquinol oxidase subunit II
VSLADVVLAVMWVGLTAYALLGGADFGGGVWDLLAGDAQRGRAQRELIEHSIGPVWEANHVWLIFVLVVLWTGFPVAFAAVMTTLYVPLTLAAVGVILRGAAFAFRKAVPEVQLKRLFGATFAASSILTPFCLGAVAGGIASGRVPRGNARGEPLSSWVNPTSLLGGTLAVAVCAYLAAVYLTRDAERSGHADLAATFRRRGIAAGIACGVLALAGVAVLRADAPDLFKGLTSRAAPLVGVSAAAGLASLVLLARRAFVLARPAAALAVTAVLWGWGVGQYPNLLEPDLTVEEAAAADAALVPLLVTMGVAGALVVPSLVLLFVMFQRRAPEPAPGREDLATDA